MRFPVVGFVAFLIAGLFFVLAVLFDFMLGLLLFACPMLMIAALFYSEWRWQPPHSPTLLDNPL